MNPLTRRQWLTSAIAAPAALAVGGRLQAIEPIPRPGPAHVKLSIAAYGFRKFLDLKKPTMTLEQFIELSASYGLGAVELTSYYFAETTPAYLARIKNLCTRLGLDVSGTAVNNDFCLPDKAKRADEMKKVREWLDRSAYLGAKAMRVFAGKIAKGEKEETARAHCVECLQEVCEHAAKAGVFVAVENHHGITDTPEQLLAIVKGVKHDWFGVNLDTYNFNTADPYGDVAKVAPYAVTVQMKTEMKAAGKSKEPADYARLFGILKTAGYRGYVALEYEAEEDPKTGVPKALKAMRVAMG